MIRGIVFVLLSSCSLAFPLDEYDQGPSTGGTAAGGGGGGPEGGGGATGGEGGAGGVGAMCGEFPNPPLSEVVSTFDTGVGEGLALLNCAVLDAGEVLVEADEQGEYCWFFTTESRRLTCDAITVKITSAGSQEVGIQRFIYVRRLDGEGDLNLLQEGAGFSLEPFVLDDSAFSLPSDTWWRLSADADDVITFETSPDGFEWTVRGGGPSPFPLGDVAINVGAGNYGGVVDPGQARFDCFNVAPPCP